ncbi:MAG: adenosylcobinamide-phosphate synthase CbiB [Treponema sp.]|nr:adenosylcobinamide-phosphate synthase CbiB [Treponema sp.]
MNFYDLIFFHLVAFFSGFVLDLIFGDPHFRFHPVCLIGNFVGFLERHLNRFESSGFSSDDSHSAGSKSSANSGDSDFSNSSNFVSANSDSSNSKTSACSIGDFNSSSKKRRRRGFLTVFLVCLLFMSLSFCAVFAGYRFSPILGCFIEAVLTYFLLALKSLKTESMKVYERLENGTLDEARRAVSMIVGRDTENLSDEQVSKAAVETVAENASDGVVAPMFFLALGGPVLGFFYKCVNTMDSMIGYKNGRFIDFGRVAAKLDDFVNFLPSRFCALLMVFSCFFLGKDFDAKNAWKIFLRDRFKHESPNSAQTESACAGALRVQLAGPAFYEGRLEKKPFLGDSLRKIGHDDIKKANRLLYSAAFLAEAIFCLLMIGVKCTAAIFIQAK